MCTARDSRLANPIESNRIESIDHDRLGTNVPCSYDRSIVAYIATLLQPPRQEATSTDTVARAPRGTSDITRRLGSDAALFGMYVRHP